MQEPMVMVMVMVMAKIKNMIPRVIKDKILGALSKNDINNSFLNKIKKSLSDYDMDFTNPVDIDLHSHLLPGIDDGVRTLEESIMLIKELKELGYTKLITTPHIISDSYPNTKYIIENKLLEVQKALDKENIDIKIEAAAEHYVDTEFLKMIENDELVPFSEKYILFETSYISKPIILEQAIFDMTTKGFIPVLAHPERYRYMHHDINEYLKLKELGVLFQINVKSLRNSSGSVYDMLMKLINLGLADFVGSDVHRKRDVDELKIFLKRKEYKHIFEKNTILNTNLI